jgi:hypothetical protein
VEEGHRLVADIGPSGRIAEIDLPVGGVVCVATTSFPCRKARFADARPRSDSIDLVDQKALASSAVTENTDVALGVFTNMLE